MTNFAYRRPEHPVCEYTPLPRALAALYALEPPLVHEDGVSSHVVVEAVPAWPFVQVSPAYADGRIAGDPIGAPIVGRLDHSAALTALGYSVVGVVSR